jgi:hypothetical protein
MDAAGADADRPPPSRTAIKRPSPSLPVCDFEGLRWRGSTTGDERRLFEEWVEQCLVTALSQGDIVLTRFRLRSRAAPEAACRIGRSDRRDRRYLRIAAVTKAPDLRSAAVVVSLTADARAAPMRSWRFVVMPTRFT